MSAVIGGHGEVHGHGGHGHDDMALLLLEHGASSQGSANGHPAAAARAAVKTVTVP